MVLRVLKEVLKINKIPKENKGIEKIIKNIKNNNKNLNNKLVLDIGCGEKKLKGAIGVDVRKTKDVDIIADARYLPFKDEVFDHVYSSHLIEHFSHREVKEVIKEWVRVLKRGYY